MSRHAVRVFLAVMAAVLVGAAVPAIAQWVTRDHRWPPRGAWNWVLPRELPQLYREFNGIDFGHAHLAETLLRTQDEQRVEQARLEVLDFIFSSPAVPPDEEQVAPTFVRMVWEAQRAFNWSHTLHRSLYDLFASDVVDKEAAYHRILADYLDKPEAITPHQLDHHGKLWSFPESKAFRDKFRTFNTQIWAYHWLQAAVYDVQLMGNAERQRQLMPKIIESRKVFLSHSSSDTAEVEALRAALDGRGIACFLDALELKAGDALTATLKEQVQDARAFVVVRLHRGSAQEGRSAHLPLDANDVRAEVRYRREYVPQVRARASTGLD
jgi:hypothetical protein